jgi:LPXTG-site transpeptidase (sortase) family protein
MKKNLILTLLGLVCAVVLFAVSKPSTVISSPAGFTNTPLPTDTLLPTETTAPTQPPAPTATAAPTLAPTRKPAPHTSQPQQPTALPFLGNGALPVTTPEAALGQISIPALKLTADLQAVPWTGVDWDISGLGQNVGWLEFTASPGEDGNSVLIGHLDMAGGRAGPFDYLTLLRARDEIAIRLGDTRYVYQVSHLYLLGPNETWVLDAKAPSQLTLVTCLRGTWDEKKGAYQKRLAVTSHLVKTEPVK